MPTIDTNLNPTRSGHSFDSRLSEKLLIRKADRGADLNRGAGSIYGSPLVAAAHLGNLEAAKLLVNRGADVNASFEVNTGLNDNGDLEGGLYGSALIAAVDFNRMDCAQFLIEQGADVNALSKHCVFGSALTAAIFGRKPSLEMVRFLVEEQRADLTLLTYRPPLVNNGVQRPWDKRTAQEMERYWEERRRIVQYLVQQCQVDTSMMLDESPIDLGCNNDVWALFRENRRVMKVTRIYGIAIMILEKRQSILGCPLIQN